MLTRSNPHYLRDSKTVVGMVEDSTLREVTLVHNGTEIPIPVNDGRFEHTASLVEGENRFRAYAIDSTGTRSESDEIVIVRVVDHAPKPAVQAEIATGRVTFTASGNDPDGDIVTFTWQSDDARNPAPLNLQATGDRVTVTPPAVPGQYFLLVTARDPQGHTGQAQAYFEVDSDGTLRASGIASNPSWVRDAIVYEIFVPAFSDQGTLAGIIPRLPDIRDLGATVIWLMPIFENGETINELNAGYNITDFFKIHPQLGTIGTFRQFLRAAHDLGLRVILDITPNHVSGNHPFVTDIQTFRDFSNYRPIIEHRILGSDRGLGQFTTTVDGYVLFAHYSNWHLANLNYSNIETIDYMLGVFKHWLLDEGVDGYRMDVYWGPQNRYGTEAWWGPFRREIKRVQPDVFILGETDGTGPGSESNYADGGGACDAAYDWNFYNQVKDVLSGGSIQALDDRVRNFSPTLAYNHFTGPNAHYFRFLENHDETRLARLFDRPRSLAAATLLFTVPGIPLIYAGQEVGETSRRGRIQWNRDGAEVYRAHYRKLAAIRHRFAAFRSPRIKRVMTSSNRVYAYLRPQRDENAVVAVNFSSTASQPVLFLSSTDFDLTGGFDPQKTYYFTDVLNDTFYTVTAATLPTYSIHLPEWGAAVLVLADSILSRVTRIDDGGAAALPERLYLYPAYPNPFNPETHIGFDLPQSSRVRLTIRDSTGREVVTLVNGPLAAGRHRYSWAGTDARGLPVSSGVYFVSLSVNAWRAVRKVVLLR